MKYLGLFLLGILYHWFFSNYVTSRSIKRKVLLWNKHAYFIKDLGKYSSSTMDLVIEKIENIENGCRSIK